MFALIGFVGVPNEFVITIKVEQCIFHDLDLVILVYVGTCCVKVFAGSDGFGNACFNLFEIFVKCILLKDLPEVIMFLCFGIGLPVGMIPRVGLSCRQYKRKHLEGH